MCARTQLTASGAELAQIFDLDEVPVLEPRYNVAPSQELAAIRVHPDLGRRRLAPLAWGLVPPWAEDRRVGHRMINARVETAATRPGFRDALRERRCLIPVTGFYEWQRHDRRLSQPFLIRRRDLRPMALAGLWERWRARDGGPAVESCTILTTEANAEIAPVHDRMPLILEPDALAAWLDPAQTSPRALASLMIPARPGPLELVTVSTLVNDPRREGPEVAAPAPPLSETRPLQRSLFEP